MTLQVRDIGSIKHGHQVIHELYAFTIPDENDILRLGFVVTSNTQAYKSQIEPLVILTPNAFDRLMDNLGKSLRTFRTSFEKEPTYIKSAANSTIHEVILGLPKEELSELGVFNEYLVPV